MATFPALKPATRTFTPGRHPHSEIPTLDGLQTRVRTSNVILEQQLRLTFLGLTEAEMLSIRSHYIGQQGRFTSFFIPTSLLSGMTTPADFTPTGYSWIYGSTPQVEDIPGTQRYNVSVELITIPPEGANVNGAEFAVLLDFVPGAVDISINVTGANLTAVASIVGGVVADNTSAGLNLTAPVSLVAGTAAVNATSAGFDLTITASFTAGTASGGSSFNFLDPANIGLAVQGGYFVGLISHTANGVATHALIAAPVSGGTGAYQIKTTSTTTANTGSLFDGAANTAAMVTAGIALHPAAQFCVGLTLGGYNDWYLPAQLELDIAYFHLKPGTTANNTGSGINAYSVPARASNYTSGTPGQTAVTAFRTGGAQTFGIQFIGSSTEWSGGNTRSINLSFDNGGTGAPLKATSFNIRAFRKVAL
jgi:hypothetical protein